MKSMNEYLNEVYIKEATQKLNATNKPEDCIELLANIMLRMREGATAPIPVIVIPQIVWNIDPDAEAKDVIDGNPAYDFIADENGELWLPLYTSVDEIEDTEGASEMTEVTEMPIRDIVKDALYHSDVSGLLINPFTERLALRKELVFVILELYNKEDL